MRISRYISASVAAVAMVLSPMAYAQQQIAVAMEKPDCPTVEPDSLQISWVQPCEEGNWLLDTETGCRMWDWHPDPKDHAAWTGSCPGGQKDGHGVVQWFEHGQAIDRFEGTYSEGKREGFGRYQWNETDRYEGRYANDVPDGFGTAVLAGQTFAGDWKNGCLAKGDQVVAIGVPRTSCTSGTTVALTRPQTASF
jgi:hypothetical protein